MSLLEKTKPLLFGKPDISEEEIEAVVDVLKSGWIGTGKVSDQFEAEFKDYMGGIGYCVSVSSATMGLKLALMALGVGKGDKVVTTPLTFCATVNAILSVGATPLFVDVDQDGLLEPSLVWGCEGAKAVLPVHYTGMSANMRSLIEISNTLKMKVIEDAAHSFGGTHFGHKQGSMGDLGVFSFYATKNITSGEGGMVYTKDKDLAEKVRILSKQGQSAGAWDRYTSTDLKSYRVEVVGEKGNMPDILAAIGLSQLRRWPDMKENRSKIWRIYEESFGDKGAGHSQHLYTIRINKREEIRERLADKGIMTGIHYEALHLEPAYKFLGYKEGDFPMAEKIGKETLSLPLSNGMGVEDAYQVVREVKKIIGGI